MHVTSSVPVGAGLSSSAALICSVAVAATGTGGAQVLDACIRAEREGVGAPTGGLDQTVALLAVARHALLLDFSTGSRTPVPWDPDRAGLELVVVDTGTRHSHTTGGYGDRRREGEAALAADPDVEDALLRRRRRHVRTENDRVLSVVDALAAGDWARVGRHFTESHASLRDDYEVSCPELDLTVDAALTGGALGARMTGGGFGGCALVLVPTDRRDAVLAGVHEALTGRGWTAPVFLPTVGGTAAEPLAALTAGW